MIVVGSPIGHRVTRYAVIWHARMRQKMIRDTVVISYASRRRIWLFGLLFPPAPMPLTRHGMVGLGCLLSIPAKRIGRRIFGIMIVLL